MAHASFVGDQKLILLLPIEGMEDICIYDVIDIYSEWKVWMMQSDNAKYLPAFRTVGGDPAGSGITLGSYFFLQNQIGWRIRPHETNHTMQLIGNLYAEDPGLQMFIPTLGSYTVPILMERSSLTQVVSLDGSGFATPEEIAASVLDGSDIEAGFNLRESLRIMLAVLSGNMEGKPIVRFRDVNNTKDRLVADIEPNKRTVIERDVS